MKFKERDTSKPAEQQGIFRKFQVSRVDGSDVVGGKHFGCRYFVLDMDHDAHAPAALRAYADSCASTHPELAADLRREFGKAEHSLSAQDEVPDTSQDWAKLDGAVAWHLIERHADNWAEVGNMMQSWLAARMAAAPAPIQQGQLVEVGQMIEFDDHEDPRFHTIICDWDNEARAKLTAGTKIYAASTGSQVQAAGDALDAARYRFIRDHICNSLTLERDGDHACNYVTATQWIEECNPEAFEDVPAEEIKAMKDTNTIWRLQIYPHTPIGFVDWHGATLDSVIDAAMKG